MYLSFSFLLAAVRSSVAATQCVKFVSHPLPPPSLVRATPLPPCLGTVFCDLLCQLLALNEVTYFFFSPPPSLQHVITPLLRARRKKYLQYNLSVKKEKVGNDYAGTF